MFYTHGGCVQFGRCFEQQGNRFREGLTGRSSYSTLRNNPIEPWSPLEKIPTPEVTLPPWDVATFFNPKTPKAILVPHRII